MGTILVGTWVATSAWVGFDATRRVWSRPASLDAVRIPSPDRPWQWALAAFVLWPVAFPVYVYRRANTPLKSSARW